MTVTEAKVRVVLRIDPFLLCSAVQVFLAKNRQLDVVIAGHDPDSDDDAARAPQRSLEVALHGGGSDFEITRAEQKEYCRDLVTLAGQINTFAARSLALGASPPTHRASRQY